MKDYEKAIEEAANNFATRDGHFTINPLNEAGIRATIKGFEAGAKSPEAKELHQQGMYSEEDVETLLNKAFGDIGYGITIDSYPDGTLQQARGLNKWFMQNKKK